MGYLVLLVICAALSLLFVRERRRHKRSRRSYLVRVTAMRGQIADMDERVDELHDRLLAATLRGADSTCPTVDVDDDDDDDIGYFAPRIRREYRS